MGKLLKHVKNNIIFFIYKKTSIVKTVYFN